MMKAFTTLFLASQTPEVSEAMKPGVELMLKEGLPIMGIGMASIFIVIGIIILVVSLLGKIDHADGNFAKGLKALFTGKK